MGSPSVVWLVAFAAICGRRGVRVVKRRTDGGKANTTAVVKDFAFHFEPIFKDSTTCDVGHNLNGSSCLWAERELRSAPRIRHQKPFRDVLPENLADRVGGCALQADQNGWWVKYNPDSGRKIAGQSAKSHVRLCGGAASKHQMEFLVLGPPGGSCEGSPPLERSQCLAAAFQIVLNKGEGKHNLRYKKDKSELGQRVPKGCSIKTGTILNGVNGTWAVFFNEDLDAPETNDKFSPVCGQHPWGVKQQGVLGETRGEDEPLSIAPGSFAQQNTTSSACDSLSFSTCCMKTECGSCASRRRHTSTFCPWYADIACCQTGTPCRCADR